MITKGTKWGRGLYSIQTVYDAGIKGGSILTLIQLVGVGVRFLLCLLSKEKTIGYF